MTRPTLRITEPDLRLEDLAGLREVVESGWLTGGATVRAFEAALGAFLGAEQVVACSSGTAALQLALEGLGVGPGAEVLVPAFTFPATANVVERAGARPVLVDVELESYNMDPARAEAAITPRARALMPVHQFGHPADLAALGPLSVRRGLCLIEDAACALGAEHDGRRCGTVGRAGCFSFHPRKVLTTAEGGAVVTDDAELASACREIRNHGLAAPGGVDFRRLGDNRRMSDVHAALGLPQLSRLPETLARRAFLASRYSEALCGEPELGLPGSPGQGRHGWQSYVVLLPEAVDREGCIRRLGERGIQAVAPARAIHLLPYYRDRYGFRPEDYPQAARADRSALALPLFPAMDEGAVDRVADAVHQVLEGARP
jgi:perosamine synthetase